MTERKALEASWARTRGHLGRASALLPPNLVESDEGGILVRYREYMDHNELELALDELEGLGTNNAMQKDFWMHLRAAAQEMKRAAHVSRFETRIDEAAG